MKSANNQNMKVYVYQWVDFDNDYVNADALGRLGGNGQAAGRLRGIERNTIDNPNEPQWIIAARRKNMEWGVTAVLKVRKPTPEESRRPGKLDKYVYFDLDQSVILAPPGSPAVFDVIVNERLNKVIGENTRGENGKEFTLPVSVVNKLIAISKTSLRARLEELAREQLAQEQNNAPLLDLETEIDALNHLGLIGEDVDALAKRRLGQGAFRRLLESEYGTKCFISGLPIRKLLIASHIIPWSKASPKQKIDPNNGLLLSTNWDSVFDKGFITFNEDGTVILSKALDAISASLMGIHEDMKLSERVLTEERINYLKYHRENVFDKF